MKILVLIPARGGSKRLPGKNLLPLGGRPLIEWSIRVIEDVLDVKHVLVSTDDSDIAAVARALGAMVPWLRPTHLATDTATSVDVALHAYDWYEAEFGAVDGIMLLQPTSPLRSRRTIEEGIRLFKEGNQAIVGVSLAGTHPLRALKLEGENIIPWSSWDSFSVRSQDLPKAYALTGSFYLISPSELRSGLSFFPTDAKPLLQENLYELVDIDRESDYLLAQALLPFMDSDHPFLDD